MRTVRAVERSCTGITGRVRMGFSISIRNAASVDLDGIGRKQDSSSESW